MRWIRIMRGEVLLIEDREDYALSYEVALKTRGFEVTWCRFGNEGLEALRAAGERVDCVITDFHLPDIDGLELLKRCQEEFAAIPVVFVTAHGSVQTAIRAMKFGAFDYVEKPVSPLRLAEVVTEAASQKRRSHGAEVVENLQGTDLLVGRSEAMIAVYKEIGRVTDLPTPVLIRGETGTGKDLVAQAIHQNSPRAESPFRAINCSAIPDTLLESELFGHEKGAFTGAHQARKGLFEMANGGTLFLDEIGDMPMGLQSKLLRVIQEGRVQRLGAVNETVVDVRLLAATHRPIPAMLKDGVFREDLYHRLAVVEIELPALRQRRDDIPLLINYFLQRYATEYGFNQPSIEADAVEYLCRQAWPGNVRQLQNSVRKALLRARNLTVTLENVKVDEVLPDARLETEFLKNWVSKELDEMDEGSERRLRERLMEKFDRVLLAELLHRFENNRTRVAEVAGVTRLTLRRRLGQLGL